MTETDPASRKRPLQQKNIEGRTNTSTPMVLCSICQSQTAVYSVPASAMRRNHQMKNSDDVKHMRSKDPLNPNTPLCLLHFYTTDACRFKASQRNDVTTVINPEELKRQLPKQQEMFAEAFLQVQREIQDAMSSSSNSTFANIAKDNDPLSIIVNLNQRSQKKRNPLVHKRKGPSQKPLEGGFLRDIPIPERLKFVQQQQARQQQELIARMNQSSLPMERNLTKRRTPTRTSVWQVLSNDDRKPAALPTAKGENSVESTDHDNVTDQIPCTCGSHQVQIVSSNSNMNQNMSKAETWGSKDRHDEIVTRYICASCGKTWNEVG